MKINISHHIFAIGTVELIFDANDKREILTFNRSKYGIEDFLKKLNNMSNRDNIIINDNPYFVFSKKQIKYYIKNYIIEDIQENLQQIIFEYDELKERIYNEIKCKFKGDSKCIIKNINV